jgi:hypothetical protein
MAFFLFLFFFILFFVLAERLGTVLALLLSPDFSVDFGEGITISLGTVCFGFLACTRLTKDREGGLG